MKFRMHNADTKGVIKQYIDKCKDDVLYDVEIKRHTKMRSPSQNRLYWLYIACIVDETDNDRDTIHYELRRRFLPLKEKVFAGETTIQLTSTTELDTAQFTRYIDRIVAFAHSELGIILPNPEDRYFEQFYEQYKDYI